MIFIDSGFLYAYVNEREALHGEVKSKMKDVLSGKYGSILISNFIVDETLTLARARTKKCNVGKRIQELINKRIDENQIITTLVIDSSLMILIDKKYEKFCEKGLTYTDCSILAIMESNNISFLATTAKEFEGLVTII
ncbi:MAG: type II toxin-antitoxin system VapC family toxin [Candidatus Hodarchaeales archaeon]|jgi:predicted nucleic acid-binding protein